MRPIITIIIILFVSNYMVAGEERGMVAEGWLLTEKPECNANSRTDAVKGSADTGAVHCP